MSPRTEDLLVARLAGAGNRFLVVDGIAGALPADPADLARRTARTEGADGVLLLDRDPSGRLRMAVYNGDGSRPEACGNGLRCLAAHVLEAGHAPGDGFTVETDAGPRAVRAAGGALRVGLGRPRIGAPVDLGDLPGARQPLEGTPVDLGNPHLVLWREALLDREVHGWGPVLERDPRFPRGTNVEFVVAAGEGLGVRVWERGVGETAACGTGAGAAAAIARRRGMGADPMAVELPGGTLEVTRDRDGELWLCGPIQVWGGAPGG